MEGDFEETVQSDTTGVDGRNASRRQHHVLFLGVGADISQKGGLARSGSTCQEKRAVSVLDNL